MKMDMAFMVLLNFLRVNTQMTGLMSTSKNTLSAEISNYVKKLLVDKAAINISHSESINSQIHNNSMKLNVEYPPASLKRSIRPVLSDVRFFHSWREAGTKKIDNGNFTLENSTSSQSNEYDLYTSITNSVNEDRLDSMGRHVSQIKAILVKDTRYRSLMKKWITNRRHGRARGDFSQIDSSSMSDSTPSNVSRRHSNTTKPSEKNPPPINENNNTKSNSSIIDEEPCILENKTNNSCNSTSASPAEDKSSEDDDDDPEARFYDPLMPYPEEYPEEYQTIQNGPALIISRTTYTRIPNVTYTTITMVTLPTYRLVEKAENAFAATLFEERSSKSSRDLDLGADCKIEHRSSTWTDFLQHSR